MGFITHTIDAGKSPSGAHNFPSGGATNALIARDQPGSKCQIQHSPNMHAFTVSPRSITSDRPEIAPAHVCPRSVQPQWRRWGGVAVPFFSGLALLIVLLTPAVESTALAALSTSGQPAATTALTRADRILVRPKASANRTELLQLYAGLGCRVRDEFPRLGGITVLELGVGVNPAATLTALRQSDLIAYAEPDLIAHALTVANDPYYITGNQWNLKNTGALGGVAGADIMAEQAWSVAHDASNIIVAVVDSGIRYTHEDLAANMWTNSGETGLDSLGRDKRTNGIDDDGDGYIDDVHGINVLNHSGDPNDDWGHGTHVAGTVGAVGNNGVGIAGINWGVKLMACKFIDRSGNYSVSDAITALDYARSKGANIVTGAWGGATFASAALRDALMALRDANIIFVAAAGNTATNNDSAPLYPASYDFANIIAVAATDRTDALASFSDYGAQSVDLGAPGVDIFSCWFGSDSDYRTDSGTSMASAQVAGACALVWAHFPGDTYQQVISRILATVDPLPSLAGKTVSGGRLNLAAALSAPVVPVVPAAGDTTPPSISSFLIDLATATHTSASFVVTFSEPVTGVDATDFATTTQGNAVATITGVTTTSSTVYRVNFDFAGDTGSIQMAIKTAGAGIADAAANPFVGAGVDASEIVPLTTGPAPDLAAPTVTGFSAGSPTSSAAIFTLGFSEAVTGVTADDFILLHPGTLTATIGTIVANGTGTTYTIPVTCSGTGTLQVMVRGGATANIRDAATNWFAGDSGQLSAVVVIGSAGSAPTITSAATDTGIAGVAFIYQITASGSPTTFAATNLAGTGLTLDSATGLISGTTIATGTIISQLTATNAFGAGVPFTLTITVSGPAAAPTITSATTASATVGAAFSYQITASGSPTSYAATNLTGTGLSLAVSSGTISGTPNATGTILSRLTATNAVGTSTGVTLTITVNAVSTGDTIAPTISSFALDLATATNTNASFVVTFSEPVTGVDATDFVVNTQGTATATLTGVTPVSSAIYRVNFDYTGTSGSIQVAIKTAVSGITDTASNAFIGGGFAASDIASLVSGPPSDITSPTVTRFVGGASTSSSASFVLTFSEPVTGVSAGDFVILSPSSPQATIGTISSDSTGTVYTIPVTFSGAGPWQFSVQLMAIGGATANIRDVATNWFAGSAGAVSESVTITSSGSAPVISNATSASATVGAAFSFQITASGSPTSYAATNFIGTGLTLDTSSGLISGTLNAAGTISIQLTATNATGPSAAVTLTITVSAATVNPPVVAAMTVNGTAGVSLNATVSGTNSPTHFTLTGQPSGVSIQSTTGVISGAPAAAGTYAATATASNVGGSGSAMVTFNIAAAAPPPPPPPPPPATQSVTFDSPASAVLVGVPTRLGATASSGLPIVYTVISGNATIAADTLKATTAGTVVIRASQAGNSLWAAGAAVANITVQKSAQAIHAASTPVPVTADASIALDATASSGLPVTYTLLKGPATLSGNTLTFTGATGTVIVQITQGGNDAFNAAADVRLTFTATALGQQIYFGKLGANDFAAAIAKDNTHGTLITYVAATGQALIATFDISASGFFSTGVRSVQPVPLAYPAGATVTAVAGRTFTGTLVDGVLSGSVPELGSNFMANVQSAAGPTAVYAGLYTAGMPGSASGATYLVVGPNGQAYALVITSSTTMSGTGNVSASGQVTIATSGDATLTGSIDPATTALTGHIRMSDATVSFAGISAATTPTDRLVNISSRVRVTGNDAMHTTITGFVITGVAANPILLRAVGPSLSAFGINDGAPNLELRLFDSRGGLVASNRGWSDDPALTAAGDKAGAFRLAAGSADAALVVSLPPGAYTAQVLSTGSGIGLVEVYDLLANATAPTKQMINLSTRGYVSGDDVIIGGFVINGNQPKRVVIRAVGPGLAKFGVPGALADPVLALYDAKSSLIARNDNWGTPQPIDATQSAASAADVVAANTSAGAFPLDLGSADACVVIALAPGAYSAVVRGVAGSAGAALIEVYEVSVP
jgi:subtilisin family serine protease